LALECFPAHRDVRLESHAESPFYIERLRALGIPLLDRIEPALPAIPHTPLL
ncbi:MAG: hypothetical protein RLZZ416_515, partial [Candidatus Parcubacteria bacterium]